MLLGRPHQHFHSQTRIETVNDKDAFIENFWRALKAEPDMLAKWCDWPVNEAALQSRHRWLCRRRKKLTEKIMKYPDYYHLKIAGWWVWGISMWIGGGWCSTSGRRRPHLSDAGMGVHRSQRPYLSDAGIRPNVAYFEALATRLRRVRVCCGDWMRVLGPTPTEKQGLTGIFLDPPYGDERTTKIYREDDTKLYLKVRDWAIEHGDNTKLRIAMCGYDSELTMPDDWVMIRWKPPGGYASRAKVHTKAKDNIHKEVIWFSPHCVKQQMGLAGRPL